MKNKLIIISLICAVGCLAHGLIMFGSWISLVDCFVAGLCTSGAAYTYLLNKKEVPKKPGPVSIYITRSMFRDLIQGKEINLQDADRRDEAKIILADIGYIRMLDMIDDAMSAEMSADNLAKKGGTGDDN